MEAVGSTASRKHPARCEQALEAWRHSVAHRYRIARPGGGGSRVIPLPQECLSWRGLQQLLRGHQQRGQQTAARVEHLNMLELVGVCQVLAVPRHEIVYAVASS